LVVIDNSTNGASYKGLTITNNNLYLANFTTGPNTGTVDVFTNTFASVLPITFVDPSIPITFAPFNVVYIKPFIYVLYAKKDPTDPGYDLAGIGNGYINKFRPDGTLVRRFACQGPLNSPWAMILAPDFLNFPCGSFLVGNFGDGKIHVYDSIGNFIFTLKSCDGTVINGLWGLTRGPICTDTIYFASGPDGENNGLVGRLTV